jgi:nucleoid-associated protein YgaU
MTASGRALFIVVVVSAGLSAFVAGRFLADLPGARSEAAASNDAAAAESPPAPPLAPLPVSATTPAPAAAGPRPEPPRFDVVRVGARGVAVVAGRAAARAEVVLLEDGREIGRSRADARGEWVILPPDPLRPGTRQFTLIARLGGIDLAGTEVVLISVPEPAPLVAEASRPYPNALREEAGRQETARQAEAARLEAMAHRHAELAAAEAVRAEAARRQASRAEAEPRQRADLATAEAARDLANRAVAARQQSEQQAAGARQQADAARRRADEQPAARQFAALAAPADEAAPRPAQDQALVVLLPAAQATPRVLQGPAARQGLALGVVDYDEAGSIRFAGTASPNATVRIYVNDQHAGDAQADAQGQWALAPGERIAYGRHRLRLDQIAAAGAVAARIEVPFQRDRLAETPAAEGRVVVQPGNNLWRLARATYGSGTRFTVIFDANRDQISNPDMIFPGQVFALPPDASAAVPAATPADSSRSR